MSSIKEQQNTKDGQSSTTVPSKIPPHLRQKYLEERAAFIKKKQEAMMLEYAKKKQQQENQEKSSSSKKKSSSNTEILPQPMRGLGMKSIETSMDFLVRLSDVNNSARAVQQQREKINSLVAVAKDQNVKRKLLSSLPDLTRLLLEVDMRFDRSWGIPNSYRGYFFIAQIIFVLAFSLVVPWSIVNARNSEVSLWAKQAAASWSRSWLTDVVGSDEIFSDSASSGNNVINPVPSASFVVAGNDGVSSVFKRLFDESGALPSSWIPIGSLVFSIAMADAAKTLCPSSIAPVPVATTPGSTARSVTCMPFDLSLSNGLADSSNYRLQGIRRGPANSPRQRINIDATQASFIGDEGDLICLGAVCAPQSFRQVGWSFPSVNRYPHNPANFLKWRLAAPMNSTSWRSSEGFTSDQSSQERTLYYSSTEFDGAPGRLDSKVLSYDAIGNLIQVPGPYLGLAIAEFSVFDVSSDSLIFFSLGFETEGGAGAFTGKLHISSFSMGEDGRNLILRTASIIFSVCLLSYTILLPFAKVFLVNTVANCSGCHFDDLMKRRPFKTVTWAKCVSCKQPVLVKGAEAFRCDSCNAIQPAAEHHRCWRACLYDPGWILNFWCSFLGLLWGGADGVTLGHASDFLSMMQSQVTQYGASFLSFRNIATLMNLHQRGLGAMVLLLTAINAQRIFWHVCGGPIALAWLQVWRRATGIFATLFSYIVFVAVICSWSIGLPAYRNGAVQGSQTESFDPPGIVFNWSQSVVWWLGRFFMLALVTLGLSIVVAGGSASSRVDAAAQMLYDPDWKSTILVWIMFKKWAFKEKKGDDSLPPAQREAAMKAKEKMQEMKEQEDILRKEKEKEEAEAARSKSLNSNNSDEKDENENKQQQKEENQLPAKHPVDPVLDEMDKEAEFSADPLTRSVDKLERCVSNLMLQLPPILEDAVDERVHFSLMEQSRKAVTEESEIEKAKQFDASMQHVEGMRQAEWERQLKVLEELEDFYEDEDEEDDEEEDDDDEDDFAALSAVREESRPRYLSSSPPPNFGDEDDEIEQGIALMNSESMSSPPKKRIGKEKGMKLRPQSSMKFDPDENPKASSSSSSPKFGKRGLPPNQHLTVEDLMMTPSFANKNNKKNNKKKGQTTLGFGQKLPKPIQDFSHAAPNAQPSFQEFEDLHEAAQHAIRSEIQASHSPPPQMEYLKSSDELGSNFSPTSLFHDGNRRRQQQPPPPRNFDENGFYIPPTSPEHHQSQLPISYSPSHRNKNNNHQYPTAIPHKYRSKNPEDYVVQHLLDDDEIEDVLMREGSSVSAAPSSPPSHNNNNNRFSTTSSPARNYHQPQNDNSPTGRYSGLPQSQVLHQPKEVAGRPFGGAPGNLSLPQPPVSLTGMKPRHY